jgi:hypothetical protein
VASPTSFASVSARVVPGTGACETGTEHARFGARAAWNQGASRKEVLRMYIGGGLLALLVIVLLLVWLF